MAAQPAELKIANDSKTKQELQTFLDHVARGRQDEAEVMLKINKELALASGDITDHAKRTFKNITGFQYAVWALDWKMWSMLVHYLPKEALLKQARGFKEGSWVNKHSEHANWKNLTDALQEFINKYDSWYWSERDEHWIEKVGGAQFRLPIHVLQEYANPHRSFEPCPNFSSNYPLVRTLPDWLNSALIIGKLNGFGILRYNFADGVWWCGSWWQSARGWLAAGRWCPKAAPVDRVALTSLYDTRVKQRGELVTRLLKMEEEQHQAKLLKIYNNTEKQLYQAIAQGQSELAIICLKCLREKNQNLLKCFNFATDNEEPVLLTLARFGRTTLLTDCIEQHFIRLDTVDEQGNHALHFAAESGHIAFCEELIGKNSVLKASKVLGCYEWPKNKQGETPLHSAAKFGQIQLIQYFVKHYNAGNDLLSPTNNGDTLVHLMVLNRQHLALGELLKNYPYLSCCQQNQFKQDALMLAIATRDELVLKVVLDHPLVDVNSQDASGQTPLHLAVKNRTLTLIKRLLAKGAILTIKDNQGKTPEAYVDPNSAIGNYFSNQNQHPSQHFAIKKPSYRNLVFQGGGVKGLVYSSALRTAIEQEIINLAEIQRVGGSSAGAINALLVGLGYSLDEMDHLMGIKHLEGSKLSPVKFSEFLDGEFGKKLLDAKNYDWHKEGENINKLFKELKEIKGFWSAVWNYRAISATKSEIARVQEIWKEIGPSLTSKFGFCPGDVLRNLFDDLIRKKLTLVAGSQISSPVTFRELKAWPSSFKDMYFVGVNTETGAQTIFSYETTPDMVVADAVRISMSIPGVFRPHPMVTKDTSGKLHLSKELYVDGGMLWNYPIELFDFARYSQNNNVAPHLPQINFETLGFRLASSKLKDEYEGRTQHPAQEDATSITSIWQHIKSLMSALINKEESDHARQGNQFRTVYIDPLGIDTMDFDKIEIQLIKKALVEQARAGVLDFKQRMEKFASQVQLPPVLQQEIMKHCIVENSQINSEGGETLQTRIKANCPGLVVAFYEFTDTRLHSYLHDNLRIALWTRDIDGNTAFHIAAREGKSTAMQQLLSADPAGVNAENGQKITPYQLALKLVESQQKQIILKLLLAKGSLDHNLECAKQLVKDYKSPCDKPHQNQYITASPVNSSASSSSSSTNSNSSTPFVNSTRVGFNNLRFSGNSTISLDKQVFPIPLPLVTIPTLQERYYELNVPGDGSCLFYSIVLSVLLPLLDEELAFRVLYLKLFGQKNAGAENEIKALLRQYDGNPEFITTHAASLEVLIDVDFRQNLVDFIKKREKEFSEHLYTESGDFSGEMIRMGIPKTWGGHREIEAASQFLQRKIVVYQKHHGSLIERSIVGKKYADSLHIILASSQANSNRLDHYHFCLLPKYLPNGPSLSSEQKRQEEKGKQQNSSQTTSSVAVSAVSPSLSYCSSSSSNNTPNAPENFSRPSMFSHFDSLAGHPCPTSSVEKAGQLFFAPNVLVSHSRSYPRVKVFSNGSKPYPIFFVPTPWAPFRKKFYGYRRLFGSTPLPRLAAETASSVSVVPTIGASMLSSFVLNASLASVLNRIQVTAPNIGPSSNLPMGKK